MNKNIKHFNNDESNRLFNIWLNNSPTSFHPLDMNRWNQFVLVTLESEEEVSSEIIKKEFKDYNHRDDEEICLDSYMTRYCAMKAIYDLLKSEDKLK